MLMKLFIPFFVTKQFFRQLLFNNSFKMKIEKKNKVIKVTFMLK